MYNEDAVEIFIATEDSYPVNYFELEVSPKGQLFIADITNPSGNCSKFGPTYYGCDSATFSGKKTQIGWDAKLSIGLSVIGRGVAVKTFKINLFRLDYTTNQPTRYLSWKPTFTSPPCFHQPKYFETIRLV